MADLKQYLKWVAIILIWWVALPVVISALLSIVSAKELLIGLMFIMRRKKKPVVVRTPEDRFLGLEKIGYTFKSNYVELPIGGGKTMPRVHYIDEGPRDAKETIVCLHGEHSWSFLYRSMVPGLVKAGYRVIALDFIGFGKSDKFTYADMYNHELYKLTLRLLLDHLKVQNVTLVCHDCGGPVGLSVVKEMPEIFSRLVIMNTFLPIGLYKAGAVKWSQLIPMSTRSPVAWDMQTTRDFLAAKWKRPALIMFSDKDYFTKGHEKLFQKLLPHASNKTVVGAGHFLQEDKGEELAMHITSFIEGKL
ncbi:hypothetical protein Pcinc_012844 [Petrolisthes cinctipes]|uniref:AB hydrolase-1 domain-containing protein n=1 Tax=Petrolisthes cinctipes TaxID=88211 RepID=A0AAE1G0W8_PETCI|nr:hypothetical protein Pcinc_012844 [Petrolisthes cinctipes]